MAQYNLPQFSTSPTPSYQQQPIIKLPNYGDIYARNFSIGVQTAATAFKPIREAIDKYVEKKEKEEIEKKKEDERIFQAENRISDNTIAYQELIANRITKTNAGQFEGQIEDMLYASVDGYAANERARIVDKTISAQDYTKIKSGYIKEITDMKAASEGIKNNLDWYSKNNGTMSRYNNPKLIGLLEAQKNNELNIGRNSTGGLTVYYDDLLGNKTVYTIDELKSLRAEDSVVTRLDFTNDDKNDNIGNAVFSALEDEIGTQLGVYDPSKTLIRGGDSKSKIQTETEANQYVAGKKEETIRYLANNSIYLDETMPVIGGQVWLDKILYGDNATEEIAQARTDKFVLKYLKEEGVVNPTKAQIDEVEQIMDSYERNAPVTELQIKVKDFQIKESKQFLAEKIWEERYAVKEKPIKATTVINSDITESDEINANKITYAKGLSKASGEAQGLVALTSTNNEETYKNEIGIRDKVNSILGLGAINGVRTGTSTENSAGDFEITYDLPESVFGKNQTLTINKTTTEQDLLTFRGAAFGEWAQGIDNAKLLQGEIDYKNGLDFTVENSPAKYYHDTVTGIGGALISQEAPSSETPTVNADLTENQKILKRNKWINSAGGKKYNSKEGASSFSAYSFSDRKSGGKVDSKIVKTKEFQEKYPDYPAEVYGQEDIFGRGEELAAKQASEKLSEENQRKKNKLYATNEGKLALIKAIQDANEGDLGEAVELQIYEGNIPTGLIIPEKYSFLKNN